MDRQVLPNDQTFDERSRMLDYLEDFLALRSIKYARLDGSTHRPRRTLDIKLVSSLPMIYCLVQSAALVPDGKIPCVNLSSLLSPVLVIL